MLSLEAVGTRSGRCVSVRVVAGLWRDGGVPLGPGWLFVIRAVFQPTWSWSVAVAAVR
jgi:hypothetical protein